MKMMIKFAGFSKCRGDGVTRQYAQSSAKPSPTCIVSLYPLHFSYNFNLENTAEQRIMFVTNLFSTIL